MHIECRVKPRANGFYRNKGEVEPSADPITLKLVAESFTKHKDCTRI